MISKQRGTPSSRVAREVVNRSVACFFVLSMLLLSPAAPAQFMKPGSSPEAGFAGVWRVIAARPAPWADQRTVAKAGFPLLEQAIDVKEREVKAMGPLACTEARFSSGVTSAGDLFGGRLANATDAAKYLGLSNSSVTTYRVICNDERREYYVDDSAALVVSVGDAIYTLERPTGMDPNQYAAGFSGPAFDCAKAKTAGEQLICRDAALSKADRKMNEAYERLKTSETPESFATVRSAQRAWLAHVAKSCGSGGAMPSDEGEITALQACLDDNFSDRAERLDAAKIVDAGSLVLEPRMSLVTRAKPDTEESDIYPWTSGGAPATAFNAYVRKSLQLGKRRMDDKDLFPFGEEVADMKLYARRTYSVVRFDTRIASLQVSTFDFSGGAHEAIGEESLNWDVAHARTFSLNEVFASGKPWRKFVTDFCIHDLHDEFASQDSPDPDRSAIEQVIADGRNWLWGTDKATVHFTVYSIASFSGGEFDVDLPYDTLKPYLRSDAPPLARP